MYGFSLLPELQVEPVKKTLTEGTLFHQQEALENHNVPSANIRTGEHVMDANGLRFMRWHTEVRQLDETMRISTKTSFTITAACFLSKTIPHHDQADKQQTAAIQHFLRLRIKSSGCTDEDADPMQLAPMTQRDKHEEWFRIISV